MRFIHVPIVSALSGIAITVSGFLPPTKSATFPNTTSIHETHRPVMPGRPSDQWSGQNVAPQSDTPASDTMAAAAALENKIAVMKRGRSVLKEMKGYTGKLRKQEVVNGELLDEQTIFVKCRHQPFSLYLRWLEGDVGREVIFVEGKNAGKMIAHDGGWRSRIPAFSLSPDSSLAMRDARHPVTAAGLLYFVDEMLAVHQSDLTRSNFLSCDTDPDATFEGRPCMVFTTIYKSHAESPDYRKSITFIDKESNLPVHAEHFEWPQRGSKLNADQLDQATLIEAYSFTDVQVANDLSDDDFDRSNPEYRFR